jgi:hypothetical protein
MIHGNIYINNFKEQYVMCIKIQFFLFFCTSSIAFFIASSANMEQCNLTGGSFKYFAMSLFLIFKAY